MSKRKFKCSFVKHRKGQTYFERSIVWESVLLMLILCDDVKIKYKKNKNQITFTFLKNDVNVFCTVYGVPDYLSKTVLAMDEWSE